MSTLRLIFNIVLILLHLKSLSSSTDFLGIIGFADYNFVATRDKLIIKCDGAEQNITAKSLILEMLSETTANNKFIRLHQTITGRNSIKVEIDKNDYDKSFQGKWSCYVQQDDQHGARTHIETYHVIINVPAVNITRDMVHCVAEDFRTLQCNWTYHQHLTPEDDNLAYNLTYSINYGLSNMNCSGVWVACEQASGTSQQCEMPRRSPGYCVLDTWYPRITPMGKVYWHIEARNKYGAASSTITVIQKQNVRVKEVRIKQVITNSSYIELKYDLRPELYHIDVMADVTYQRRDMPDEIHHTQNCVISESDPFIKEASHLSGLGSHAHYAVNVRFRPVLDCNHRPYQFTGYWSPNLNTTAVTEEAVPSRSPVILGYDIVHDTYTDTRKVRMYFKDIPYEHKNGRGFFYEVEVNSSEEERSSGGVAGRENVSVDLGDRPGFSQGRIMTYERNTTDDASYLFRVSSVNIVGASRHSSSLFLPSHTQALLPPTDVRLSKGGDGSYQLTWSPPRHRSRNVLLEVQEYRVLWCKYRPYPANCEGEVMFADVRGDARMFQAHGLKASADRYQFAISATSPDGYSSHLHWTSCEFLADKAPSSNPHVSYEFLYPSRRTSPHIKLSWPHLSCADSGGVLDLYHVYYCLYNDKPDNITLASDMCEGVEYNVSVPALMSHPNVTLTNILPDKEYVAWVVAETRPPTTW